MGSKFEYEEPAPTQQFPLKHPDPTHCISTCLDTLSLPIRRKLDIFKRASTGIEKVFSIMLKGIHCSAFRFQVGVKTSAFQWE
ncbi:hypothetical protein V6N13_063920 [Hibiscus sabdariffa]|uniref:Uncharacterized protein n=1 Tax=Hibiscus sabdariffa TaxID=183260 RepID=A0ABR2R1N4_9ROSI